LDKAVKKAWSGSGYGGKTGISHFGDKYESIEKYKDNWKVLSG
jgi:hypothetical protein